MQKFSRRGAILERLENRCLLSTTYFVSADPGVPTPAGAVDLNSIQDVNALDLQPGDAVLFAGGETFAGALSLASHDSGDIGSPVLIGSFDPSTGLPTSTLRATILNSAGSALVATNVHDVTVDGLNFSGGSWQTNGGDGISFINDLGGTTKLANVTLQNLEVSNFGATVVKPKRGDQVATGGWGIRVGGAAGKGGFSHVLIEDVSVHDNERGGIEIYGAWDPASSLYANYDVTIRRANTSWNRGIAGFTAKHTGSGIILSDTDVGLIERSVAGHNGELNDDVGGPVGIWAWDAKAVVIQHNESHHNSTHSTADGGGFDLDGGVTDSVMQYNYSHDNAGAGYGLFQFSDARPFGNNVVRYNISANDGRKNNYAGIQIWNGGSGIKNTEIYNNTVYMTPAVTGTSRGVYIQTPTTGVHFRNNIFQTTGGVRLVEIVGKHTDLKFQGNAYWSTGGAFSIKDFTTNHTSLASWRNKAGQEILNGTATGFDAQNPGLTSPAVIPTFNDASQLVTLTNYRLTASSPAAVRNGGVNLAALGIVTGGQDFFGEIAPDGGYSMGADDLA